MFFDYGSRGRTSSRGQQSGGGSNFMTAARGGSGYAPSYQSGYAAPGYGRSGSQSGGYDSRSGSMGRLNSSASDRSVYGHGLNARDLSPMRESTRPRRGPMVWQDRPVSPLGSSRFERPSEYAGRQVRPSTSCGGSNPYGSSSSTLYGRPLTSSGSFGRSYQVDRGYDGAFAVNRGYDGMTNGFPEGPGLSRRNAVRRPNEHSPSSGGYEPRPRLGANFRFGGYGDWQHF
ncbi:hypothetical protein PTMSG1_09566 [Pyrenophora teres f. maculata]|nr:hypothetical protein PTMSG1_09566 [Pyrenophora teres f. maculata]